MAETRVKFFTDDQVRKFAVVNSKKFREKAESLATGLSAAALTYWADLARSTFSPSTAERYIESLYWNPSDATNIKMSVMSDTLADLLEGGQDTRDLTEIFLKTSKLTKGGKRHRVIPIDFQKKDIYMNVPRATLGLDVEEIINIVNRDASRSRAVILSKMSSFERASTPAKTFDRANKLTAAEKAVGKQNIKFRTITPASTWRHPGIRAALLANQVAEWMRLNKGRFLEELFKE